MGSTEVTSVPKYCSFSKCNKVFFSKSAYIYLDLAPGKERFAWLSLENKVPVSKIKSKNQMFLQSLFGKTTYKYINVTGDRVCCRMWVASPWGSDYNTLLKRRKFLLEASWMWCVHVENTFTLTGRNFCSEHYLSKLKIIASYFIFLYFPSLFQCVIFYSVPWLWSPAACQPISLHTGSAAC